LLNVNIAERVAAGAAPMEPARLSPVVGAAFGRASRESISYVGTAVMA